MNCPDKWDARFLGLAEFISGWSKDPSTKVGAVITRGKKIVSVGYNGFPTGVEDTTFRLNERELKYKFSVHAEANAILAAKQDLTDCTIYVHPFMPCVACAGLVIQSGIDRVVSYMNDNPRWTESFALSKAMFDESCMELVLYDRDNGTKEETVFDRQLAKFTSSCCGEHAASEDLMGSL